MKLHFEPNLDYQHTAIESVCDLFRGQEICRTEFTVTHDVGRFQCADPRSPTTQRAAQGYQREEPIRQCGKDDPRQLIARPGPGRESAVHHLDRTNLSADTKRNRLIVPVTQHKHGLPSIGDAQIDEGRPQRQHAPVPRTHRRAHDPHSHRIHWITVVTRGGSCYGKTLLDLVTPVETFPALSTAQSR